MRRIALFSDIHANPVALDAVTADMDAAGIEERYCLGDLIGYGPDPLGVIRRLRDSGVPTLQGNYDAGVASRKGSCGCYYDTEEARELGERSYEFTDRVLDSAAAEWLLAQPQQIRIEEQGARVLFTHGSPRKINEYLTLDRSEEQLCRLAIEAEADLVCHGHIHVPYHRSFICDEAGILHYVSSGSVGKPKDGDPRAAWVELMLGSANELDPELLGDTAVAPVGLTELWAAIRVHRAAYDIESVADAMSEAGLPSGLGEALIHA